MAEDLPELIVADADAWRNWLQEHHGDPRGVWLVLAKKATTVPTRLTYDQALEGALCHGWIDGQRQPRDDQTFRQLYTPRRPRSQWSRRNIGIVERLLSEGRMHEAGIAEIERARSDGRWEAAYLGQQAIEVPADLAEALRADPDAAAMFSNLSSQNRYAVLYRIESAKRPETRARRIQRYVAMLARGETLYPQRKTRPNPGA